ncbi:TPA: TauD/TfdA family dioxygenase [Klebsiella aerogenes]|nr:TauD/TfdA family dioxygenase [Klebsiella aerogenes]HDU4054863.1 TauD/TfdA family dioxygenase [Klebsiella aerogenes]
MTTLPDVEISLTNEESQQLRLAFAPVQYDPAGGIDYLRHLRRIALNTIPERLLSALEKTKLLNEQALSCVLINNLPIDQHVTGSPKFSETGASHKEGCLSENILTALGTLLGEPYSIAHEGRELVNNLTPHQEHAHEFTGLGSEVELDLHIENAAQAWMPEGDTSPFALILLGIRGEPDGGPLTHVTDTRRALSLLSAEDIKTLYEPHFIIRVPYRWRSATPKPRDNTHLVPVLSGPINSPRVTVAFYPDMVLASNQLAQQALDNLYRALNQVAFGVQITPGRLVLINNYFALHSRERFTPGFDENGCAYRWIQRLFVAPDLWNFRSFTRLHERVFDPRCETATEV